MMSLLFLLIFVAYLFIHFGKRNAAIGLFIFTLLLTAYWFRHHITDKLNFYF